MTEFNRRLSVPVNRLEDDDDEPGKFVARGSLFVIVCIDVGSGGGGGGDDGDEELNSFSCSILIRMGVVVETSSIPFGMVNCDGDKELLRFTVSSLCGLRRCDC